MNIVTLACLLFAISSSACSDRNADQGKPQTAKESATEVVKSPAVTNPEAEKPTAVAEATKADMAAPAAGADVPKVDTAAPAAAADAPKADAAVADAAKAEADAPPKADAAAPKADADAPKADAAAPKAEGGAAGGAPYKVSEDGKKVDEKTFLGYQAYTNICVPCHGRDATGGMGGGANLVEGLKKLSADDAKQVILNGRPGTLMAGFKTVPAVADNIDGVYGYLKGRSDGKIWGKTLEKMQ
ncbi:MAG: c-type cytochrome [Pseudomonadota bacterium]|nr:c-type cytochrome [Burkholderiales bacterium]MDQ3195856.1 c-type cytochrome [Pseudomonadota bacterium]